MSQTPLDLSQPRRWLPTRAKRSIPSVRGRLERRIALTFALFTAVALSPALHAETHRTLNDYPTAVLADYVLGCMAANGNSYESLHQCSCSIDYIRERIDYETYERIETIMQVQRDRGQRGIYYRDSNWAKNHLAMFENVQAESTLQCF